MRQTGEKYRRTGIGYRSVTDQFSHHERPNHDIGHLGKLVVQQGSGGMVRYLAIPQPIRALLTQPRLVFQVRTVESYLLEHLVLRLGPDVQLRRKVRQVSMKTDRQLSVVTYQVSLTSHLSILIVNVLVESSNDGSVDEQRTHHDNCL